MSPDGTSEPLLDALMGAISGGMAQAAQRGWQPHKTWVYVVGTVEWQDPEIFAPFPQEQRRDAMLVDFFRAQGVPAAQIVYLQDSQATNQQIKKTFEPHLRKAAAGDFLFVYYCGHGYKADHTAYFASYDADDTTPGWPMKAVPAAIDRSFQGAYAFLAADCCCSGSLVQAVENSRSRISYACLASSLSNEDSTANWTFTEGLLAGLRGHAYLDAYADGAITLQDLADEIKHDMAFAEEQRTAFVATGAFRPDLIIGHAAKKAHPRVGERVEAQSDGDWYRARIIDADGERFKVHYYGWNDDDDEWVSEAQIRRVTPQQYSVGARVEVKWKGEWYPATILDRRGGLHLIRYDDYDDDYDEWVSARRIR